MSIRQVRERCETLVANVRLPHPFDLEAFVANLSSDRGTEIRLLPVPLPRGAPCGLYVSAGALEYLVINDAVSGPQRIHVALHEISHLLLGHSSMVITDSNAIGWLLPHLDPAAVRAMFARTAYDTVSEQEAEVAASLLGARVGLGEPPSLGVAADPLVKRLGRSLGHHTHG
jgi:hypothetical protein